MIDQPSFAAQFKRTLRQNKQRSLENTNSMNTYDIHLRTGDFAEDDPHPTVSGTILKKRTTPRPYANSHMQQNNKAVVQSNPSKRLVVVNPKKDQHVESKQVQQPPLSGLITRPGRTRNPLTQTAASRSYDMKNMARETMAVFREDSPPLMSYAEKAAGASSYAKADTKVEVRERFLYVDNNDPMLEQLRDKVIVRDNLGNTDIVPDSAAQKRTLQGFGSLTDIHKGKFIKHFDIEILVHDFDVGLLIV